jgi:hypothetical protein
MHMLHSSWWYSNKHRCIDKSSRKSIFWKGFSRAGDTGGTWPHWYLLTTLCNLRHLNSQESQNKSGPCNTDAYSCLTLNAFHSDSWHVHKFNVRWEIQIRLLSICPPLFHLRIPLNDLDQIWCWNSMLKLCGGYTFDLHHSTVQPYFT